MRSRAAILVLGFYLCFVIAGCSSKPQGSAGEPGAANNSSSEASTSANAPLARPATIIPAGTLLNVRLEEPLGSKISQPGQSFSATVSRSVAVGGEAVLPTGTSVSGTVVDAKPLGRFAGGATLQLKLTLLKLNGSEIRIESSTHS